MNITINADNSLRLCPIRTTEKDIDDMKNRVASYVRVGIDPRHIINGYLSKEDIDSQHKVLQLLVSLALYEQVISMSDLNNDVSLFVNPLTLDINKYNPEQDLVVNVIKSSGEKLDFSFKTDEFVRFAIDSMGLSDSDLVPEDLPANSILFHSVSVVARNNSQMFGEQISDGKVSVLLSECRPMLISNSSTVCSFHTESTPRLPH